MVTVMVTEYIFRNCPFRWRTSTSIKDVICDNEHVGQGSRGTTFTMASFKGKYITSYLMTMVMFALSLTIYEIFENQIKCKMFYLKNEGQGQVGKRDLRHSTGNVRIFIGNFLQNYSFPEKYAYAKGNAHTNSGHKDTRKYAARDTGC